MTLTTAIDSAQRERALNIHQSFIVQAPAGSGKTELLVQRYLAALSTVKMPEEILAITFTKKAAGEMRERILHALSLAEGNAPESPHKQRTWKLARNVLMQDQQNEWLLRENPSRLKIHTIDAFCSQLTRQMPLLSGFGATPNIAEDADSYYRQAAQLLLNSLLEDMEWIDSLKTLLLHLDNNFAVAEDLFVNMLRRRDQWLPHITGHYHLNEFKRKLENGLQHIITDSLAKCVESFPQKCTDELLAITRYAARQVAEYDILNSCQNLQALPGTKLQDLHYWRGIARLLLTNDSSWRRSFNVNIGFPSKDDLAKLMKLRAGDLIAELQNHEAFRQSLQAIQELPPDLYTDQQWQIVEALVELLPLLVAQLTLIFRQENVVDFSEVTIAALRALGTPEAPTELALYLDHQIKHILIDEFQDTSMTQFRLIELLTAGWQQGDGRTLFLVGDPMQSIYRFREAEVGLFLKAQQEGIGIIQLENIILKMNYRSTPTVVNWINQHFQDAFPIAADISTGAIPFNTAIAAIPAEIPSEVKLHPFVDASEQLIANRIVEIIKQEQANNPNQTIAILVRSRTHLINILPTLKKADLKFSAIEIEKLSHLPIIQDLAMLTRALLHLGDRIAWLGILRAPWCGLSLADLHIIASNKDLPIWTQLTQFKQYPTLSETGKHQLERIVPILSICIHNRARLTLREWIEGAWLALGGPACARENDEINYAQTFFKLLTELEKNHAQIDHEVIMEKINKLYATSYNAGDAKLQVMTIHKAKGLEFDRVIIPNIEAKPPSDKSQLLMWMDRPRSHGRNDLILAPIKPVTDSNDPIYSYLRKIEQQKSRHEIARLFYVGATRAKINLHLLANVKIDLRNKEKLSTPDPNSFLALFWDKFKSEFESLPYIQELKEDKDYGAPSVRRYYRLNKFWNLPAMQDGYLPNFTVNSIQSPHTSFKLTLSNKINELVFSSLQSLLRQISREGLSNWNEAKLLAQLEKYRQRFSYYSLNDEQINEHLNYIQNAINMIINHERAQWLFNHQHKEVQNQLSITTLINGAPTPITIERTFVDQDNIRWIIDYRYITAGNHDPDWVINEHFSQSVKQLEVYAKALHLLKQEPIKLGIYFPLLNGWREWNYLEKVD